MIVTWATVLVSFMDCEFRVMTTEPVMKSVKNNIDVTRSKLAYAKGNRYIEIVLKVNWKKFQPKDLNLIIPLLLLLTSTFYLIWQDGLSKGAISFIDAVQQADATQAMLIAFFATVIFALILYLFHKEKISELMFHGGNQLMMAIILLVLVWALADLADDLGFSKFITGTAGKFIPKTLVPVTIFLLGSLLVIL